ncbi:acyltransferase domain protein [Oceanicola granulosus HTCC2516]|uniref:Acyltransferase domain protein n=1 Tax=Oceanicola granulosus (strain ATCC BAA-861 / DSM 15982 / KCTC 12143 / HTCC2516) TaxID=314256 RepID=Q2CIY5_OCEGH|nr:lysophospholipid acyltransferase family protein [Oceanicola granulosus]EAR52815.1 acyltransferase domain protein [Oceanicola granulosus HTCC2516]
MSSRHVARDITYATSAATRSGRAMIRVMENATGRISLVRRARGYDLEVAEGRDFWQVITDRYGLSLDVVGGSLASIPAEGPLVVVANHPYGVLDGLMMGRILSARRGGDFRVLAHRIFRKSPDLERVILPISFDATKEAARENLETRAEALRYLGQGGAIGVFPGGTVSTAARPFAPPMDPGWRTFTAKMIARSDATVVPIFFEGANSRLFQLASHVHQTLRMGMLIREFRRRAGTPVRVVVGAPVPREAIAARRGDARALMAYLRHCTYALSPRPVCADSLGFEFEAKYKPRHSGRAGGRSDGSRDLR